MDNNIAPVNSFTITQWSQVVDIMVDQRASENEEKHTNMINNECVTTHQNTLPPFPPSTTINKFITTNFTLNKKLSLTKKMVACDRVPYNVAQHDN